MGPLYTWRQLERTSLLLFQLAIVNLAFKSLWKTLPNIGSKVPGHCSSPPRTLQAFWSAQGSPRATRLFHLGYPELIPGTLKLRTGVYSRLIMYTHGTATPHLPELAFPSQFQSPIPNPRSKETSRVEL